MKRVSRSITAVMLLTLAACTGQTKCPSPNAPTGPKVPLTSGIAASTKGDVVAELNGQPITEQDLMTRIKPRLSRIEGQIYDIKRDGIDQIIEEKLLDAEAKKQNLSVQDLMKKEVIDKVGEVSDKEVEDFYKQNQARLGGKTLDELKTQIAAQLKARKASVYRNNFIDRLTAKADINVYIERPRVDVAAGNSPSKGPASAPVTVIEFTDYQCPFCAKARPTIKELVDSYKNDVHYVVRNFPLDFHPFAKKAAVAALCADQQKKYWDFSQKMWDNQKALDVDSLKKYAEEVKLDMKKFNECLDGDKTLADVSKDQQEGAKAGVSGTPAFFINGQALTGAQPIEAFKKMIDQELKEAKKKKG
ncbi:MAG: thioredoxin domain-containing protein [bacterium]